MAESKAVDEVVEPVEDEEADAAVGPARDQAAVGGGRSEATPGADEDDAVGPARDQAAVGGGRSEATPGADEDDAVDAAAELLEADLSSIASQRDEYLALAQRLQAEFENYKKQTMKRNTEVVEHAGSQLASKLLPVLDAFDNAIIQGIDGIGPIHKALFDVLQKEGLEVIDTEGVVFDPNLHEAVIHEAADEHDTEPVVSDTLRTGYLWKGRVLRPAMVKVRG